MYTHVTQRGIGWRAHLTCQTPITALAMRIRRMTTGSTKAVVVSSPSSNRANTWMITKDTWRHFKLKSSSPAVAHRWYLDRRAVAQAWSCLEMAPQFCLPDILPQPTRMKLKGPNQYTICLGPHVDTVFDNNDLMQLDCIETQDLDIFSCENIFTHFCDLFMHLIMRQCLSLFICRNTSEPTPLFLYIYSDNCRSSELSEVPLIMNSWSIDYRRPLTSRANSQRRSWLKSGDPHTGHSSEPLHWK